MRSSILKCSSDTNETRETNLRKISPEKRRKNVIFASSFFSKNGDFGRFLSAQNDFFKKSEKKFQKKSLNKSANYKNISKNFQKIFGGNEKGITFALPIGNERAAEKETKGTKKVL
jgi:hypothetical protein